MSESVQGSQTAQHIGGILEAVRVHIEPAAVGEDCTAEPHARSFADRRKTEIVPVHQIVPKHQPEVPGMVKNKRDKRETHRPHVSHGIVRVTGLLDVPVNPLER